MNGHRRGSLQQLAIISVRVPLLASVAVNRLPGLQSSKQNLEEENMVYDRMMLDLIRLLVMPPLTGCPPDQGLFEVSE